MNWDYVSYAGMKRSIQIHPPEAVPTWSNFLYLSRPFRRLAAAPHSLHTNARSKCGLQAAKPALGPFFDCTGDRGPFRVIVVACDVFT